jgi:hypothetical protein
MEGSGGLHSIFGDRFASGLAKGQFSQLKQSGLNFGSGVDAFVILEERLDLRIQVEATLSHLFDRRIALEWDSGNLVARASLGGTGASYRLDKEECHGIKELLVLLTHLYNNEHDFLIIDEPELNLHPQYQAFFMQEVRKVAGDPSKEKSKKVVFLVTHSPFILDFVSVEDLKAVISFDAKQGVPRQMLDLGAEESARLASLVPRLNVHHKQLFFSDNPVFVEGILDAQLIATIQAARGVSMAAAGSCIIDAGGSEEVNNYLDLCGRLGKEAYFIYDLDSLFFGNLRSCVRSDGSVQSFLASIGVGPDFVKYCGELERSLTSLLEMLQSNDVPPELPQLLELFKFLGLRKDWSPSDYSKARVGLLTAVSRQRPEIVAASSEAVVSDVEGRLRQACAALRVKNVIVLPGGTLERYLPSYAGHHYFIRDDAKLAAVRAEIAWLATKPSDAAMQARYTELYTAILGLPSRTLVDVDKALMDYLGAYLHDLQAALVGNANWGLNELKVHLLNRNGASSRLFSIQSLVRGERNEFQCVVDVKPIAGKKARQVHVTHETNAGMRGFRFVEPESDANPERGEGA